MVRLRVFSEEEIPQLKRAISESRTDIVTLSGHVGGDGVSPHLSFHAVDICHIAKKVETISWNDWGALS